LVFAAMVILVVLVEGAMLTLGVSVCAMLTLSEALTLSEGAILALGDALSYSKIANRMAHSEGKI